jgi:hypothetical protein
MTGSKCQGIFSILSKIKQIMRRTLFGSDINWVLTVKSVTKIKARYTISGRGKGKGDIYEKQRDDKLYCKQSAK